MHTTGQSSKRSVGSRAGGASKSPQFRQLSKSSSGVPNMNFSKSIRGGTKTYGSQAALDQKTVGTRSSKQSLSNRNGVHSSNASSKQLGTMGTGRVFKYN